MAVRIVIGIVLASLLQISPAVAAWDINKTIDETNFIVGRGCSGTLISLEHRLVLTNHHCVTDFFKFVERDVVKDGVVNKVRKEERRDVPLIQRRYTDFRNVGEIKWQGELVFRKKTSDLALIQIRAQNLPYTEQSQVYNGNGLHRTDKVFVVGNPLGLDASVTEGIISSMTRMFRVPWADDAEVPFIQVDAGMAGGNSGGALYNADGFLIGVPAAGVSGTPVGLVIPYTFVQEILTDACYEEVWNTKPGTETHDECVARMEAEAEENKEASITIHHTYAEAEAPEAPVAPACSQELTIKTESEEFVLKTANACGDEEAEDDE